MRVSKMMSQRTRSWNVARRQLAKGDFGVCERYQYIFFTLREGSLQKLILKYVGHIFFLQVGIRGNTMMKL